METPQRREYLYGTGVRVVLWRNGHNPDAAGAAVRLGDIRAMAEAIHGLPPQQPPPPTIALRNLSRPMYLSAVKAGRFEKAPAKIRL